MCIYQRHTLTSSVALHMQSCPAQIRTSDRSDCLESRFTGLAYPKSSTKPFESLLAIISQTWLLRKI